MVISTKCTPTQPTNQSMAKQLQLDRYILEHPFVEAFAIDAHNTSLGGLQLVDLELS
jgi:hypothetical protein